MKNETAASRVQYAIAGLTLDQDEAVDIIREVLNRTRKFGLDKTKTVIYSKVTEAFSDDEAKWSVIVNRGDTDISIRTSWDHLDAIMKKCIDEAVANLSNLRGHNAAVGDVTPSPLSLVERNHREAMAKLQGIQAAIQSRASKHAEERKYLDQHFHLANTAEVSWRAAVDAILAVEKSRLAN